MIAGLSHGASGTISRLVDADAKAALQALDGSPLVRDGRVNLIGLDAIVRRLGSRWPVRSDQVHDHVVKALERRLGRDGYFVRVSDADYLIVHPELSRFTAQAACLSFMRELLTYFLGEALSADMAVREVTTLSSAGLEARLVDVYAMSPQPDGGRLTAQRLTAQNLAGQNFAAPILRAESRSFAARDDDEFDDDTDAETAAPMTTDRWSPFVATDGRVIRVSCTLSPCFKLGEARQIGFRIEPRVIDGETGDPLTAEKLSRLTGGELERVDLAALARGLARLKLEAPGRPAPMLLIPVTYSTVMSRRGRANLISGFRAASHGVAQRLICEMRHIESVPPSMLFDAGSSLRSYCYAVIGRLAAMPDRRVRYFNGAGLNGLSFDAAAVFGHEAPASEADLFASIVSGVTAARRVARSVIVHGLTSRRDLAVAQLAGATHASLSPSGVEDALRARRTTAARWSGETSAEAGAMAS